ncbi:MAG: AbrB/MazE/SpoVT family DNA-binding domain-containing protein [Thermomicrobiales bacterium]
MISQTTLVRIGADGQMTIPIEFRRELGLEDDGMVRMTLHHGKLELEPVAEPVAVRGSPWVRELYEYFAPVRAEILAAGYTEEEVNADIDAAIRAVRAERE